jgi:hypothetical protein
MSVTLTLAGVGIPGGAFGAQSVTREVTTEQGDDIMAWAGYEAARAGVENPGPSDAMQAAGDMVVGYLLQQAARHKVKFG